MMDPHHLMDDVAGLGCYLWLERMTLLVVELQVEVGEVA